MPRYIAKLADDCYIQWSTIVYAPVSWTKTRAEAVAEWGEESAARADASPSTLDDIEDFNRAGPDETCLTAEQIRAAYSPFHAAVWQQGGR